MNKRSKLRLAPNLSFSTDVITEVIGLIAKRGMGKTYTATKLAEEMLTVGAQVVVIDPVGNWYGLRLGAKGQQAGGLDIKILGGRNGDIPLEHAAGKLIAKTIVESGMSVILDVSLFSKPKQRRFVTEFSEALLEYRKHDPAAMHIFWEEAYRFMPQKMTKGSKNEMLEATEELVTMGRNFGIGGTIICQRSAQVSKTVLTQAGMLIAMGTTGLADRKLIEAWVEEQKLEMEKLELSKLKKGEAYVWWPEEFGLKRIKVATKQTYNASATPQFGEKKRQRKLRGVDLAALEQAMANMLEKVKSEDPRLLRRRIAELEAALAVPRLAEKVEVPVVIVEELRELGRLSEDIQMTGRSIARIWDEVAEKLQKSFPEPPGPRRTGHWSPKPAKPRQNPPKPLKGRPPGVPRPLPTNTPKINAGALRMLKALAAISPGGLTKKQVATAAGMKSSGGTFSTYWSKLNVAGFMELGADNRWYASEAGMSYLGDDIPTQPDSAEEKVEFWCERLTGKAKEMLRYLFENQEQSFTRAELGEAMGLESSGGTFGTYLSALTSNNLAYRDGNHLYQISRDLLV